MERFPADTLAYYYVPQALWQPTCMWKYRNNTHNTRTHTCTKLYIPHTYTQIHTCIHTSWNNRCTYTHKHNTCMQLHTGSLDLPLHAHPCVLLHTNTSNVPTPSMRNWTINTTRQYLRESHRSWRRAFVSGKFSPEFPNLGGLTPGMGVLVWSRDSGSLRCNWDGGFAVCSLKEDRFLKALRIAFFFLPVKDAIGQVSLSTSGLFSCGLAQVLQFLS